MNDMAGKEMGKEQEPPVASKGPGKGRGPGSRKGQFKEGYEGGGRPKTPNREKSLLKDMRAVFGQSKGYDKTQQQKNLRKLLDADPKGFLSQMAGLERASLAKGAEKEEKKADEGGGRAVEIIERLLSEWEDRKGSP